MQARSPVDHRANNFDLIRLVAASWVLVIHSLPLTGRVEPGFFGYDGASKVGFTAPSVSGQATCIDMALASAGVDARSISYVECHGTATPLGDPIEVAGLTKAFASAGDFTCELDDELSVARDFPRGPEKLTGKESTGFRGQSRTFA